MQIPEMLFRLPPSLLSGYISSRVAKHMRCLTMFVGNLAIRGLRRRAGRRSRTANGARLVALWLCSFAVGRLQPQPYHGQQQRVAGVYQEDSHGGIPVCRLLCWKHHWPADLHLDRSAYHRSLISRRFPHSTDEDRGELVAISQVTDNGARNSHRVLCQDYHGSRSVPLHVVCQQGA